MSPQGPPEQDLEKQPVHSTSSWSWWRRVVRTCPRRSMLTCTFCSALLVVVPFLTAAGRREIMAMSERPEAITPRQAGEINERLSNMTTDEVLKWIAATFPGRTVQLTSFGLSGLVIIDKLASLGLLRQIPVVMVDTLHLFPETYGLVKTASDRYKDLQLRVFYPKSFTAGQRELFDNKYGKQLWSLDFERYSSLTKVEPTARALQQLNVTAWITGRRRSQGGPRKQLALAEWDGGRLKLNPLARWTLDEVWQHIRRQHVPYNPLHDRGYASIGDSMNTRPIAKGEPERAGRFSGSNETECGMHTHLAKVEKQLAELRSKAARGRGSSRGPTLPCDGCLELESGTFKELVLETQRDMVIEFYSPYCSHCRVMAPKYQKVATSLAAVPEIIVARMDMTQNKIPSEGQGAEFDVHGFPTICLVRPIRPGKIRVLKYTGHHNERAVLTWLKRELSYLTDRLSHHVGADSDAR